MGGSEIRTYRLRIGPGSNFRMPDRHSPDSDFANQLHHNRPSWLLVPTNSGSGTKTHRPSQLIIFIDFASHDPPLDPRLALTDPTVPFSWLTIFQLVDPSLHWSVDVGALFQAVSILVTIHSACCAADLRHTSLYHHHTRC